MKAQHESHSVFDHTNFFSALIADMRRARALVILHSPFLAMRRIEIMQRAIEECIDRRVRVCVFAQQAELNDTQAVQAKEHAASILRSLGAHVTIRPGPHMKLAVIDEEILWDGSLNMLSHRNTEERMTRWISRAKVIEATKRHKLDQCSVCTSQRSTLIDILIRRRQYLGLSQRDLARLTGIDQSALSRIESHGRDAQLTSIERILAELKLDVRAVPRYLVPVIDDMIEQSMNNHHWFEGRHPIHPPNADDLKAIIFAQE